LIIRPGARFIAINLYQSCIWVGRHDELESVLLAGQNASTTSCL